MLFTSLIAQDSEASVDGLLVVVVLIVAGLLVNGLVGYLIGRAKGQAKAGFWLGLIASVVGWIIVAVMPRSLAHEEEREMRLARARSDANPENSATNPAKAVAAKIALLQELREEGLIDDIEFEERKRKALDSL